MLMSTVSGLDPTCPGGISRELSIRIVVVGRHFVVNRVGAHECSPIHREPNGRTTAGSRMGSLIHRRSDGSQTHCESDGSPLGAVMGSHIMSRMGACTEGDRMGARLTGRTMGAHSESDGSLVLWEPNGEPPLNLTLLRA